MKKLLIAAIVGLVFSGNAQAQLFLARQKDCLACHSIDKKIIGPAYKDVAAKYASDPGAAAHLSKKVREGGTGVWGKVPMPTNPKVSEAEADSLVIWVLTLK